MYDLCDNRTEEAYPHIKANNAISHEIPRMTYYTSYCSGLLLGCALHGRVVNGHIILTCNVVQRGLTVLRRSQAFRDVMCECQILYAFFAAVAYRTCTEARSRRGIIDTRRYIQLLVSLNDFRCKGIRR